jgi:hypothetical protein
MTKEFRPAVYPGLRKQVDAPTTGLHIFNPDHDLYCDDCGFPELDGNHGITSLTNGLPEYQSPEVAEMYESAFAATGSDFYSFPYRCP